MNIFESQNRIGDVKIDGWKVAVGILIVIVLGIIIFLAPL